MWGEQVKRSRIFLLLAGLVVAAILAFFMQDVVRRALVNPLAYILWLMKLVAAAIPQLLLWILLLVALVLILISSLSSWNSSGKKHEKSSSPQMGPVETLAGAILRSKKGTYSKWVVANRLGNIMRELEGKQGRTRQPYSKALRQTEENLEMTVRRYLKAGIDESFVDYPQPHFPMKRKRATPFDLDIKIALEYLESQMKNYSGKS